MAAPKKADILVARESFSGVLPDGTAFDAIAGVTRVRAGHASAKAWPEYFEEITVDYDVEQATAAPGEKRQ